jgi:hypothetical protein
MEKNNSKIMKKKPSLDFAQMSPFHANIIKKRKNSRFKNMQKETYSSFIIKLLDETPINFNKSIKKISATAYKNLFKKSSNFKPFNTNYSQTRKSRPTHFEKLLNKIETNVVTKKESLKEYQSKDFYDSGKKLNILSLNDKLDEQEKEREIEKKKEKEKENKLKNSYNNLKRKRLNSLYGYDSNFIKSKKYLVKRKDNFELDKYQNEVLKVSQKNLSKDYMIKLFTELQFIKRDADLIKPLPPINYKALVNHCFKDVPEIKKNIKEKSLDKKGELNMDEYEKELYMIRKNNTFKRGATKRNKRMYKIYEILPEYVIDALYKKRNKQINF